MKDCIFCKIGSKQIQAMAVYEDEHLLAFRDIHPAAPVHVLLIPKQHFASLNEFSGGEEVLAGKMLLAAKEIAKQEKIADSGYRLVLNCGAHGGQSVSHVHMHILGGRDLEWPPG